MSSWEPGRSDFYVTITSTSNPSLFEDNHPAEFQVQLNQNIILDPEEWEVALAGIHYVHDFQNIGENTFLKIRHRREVYTLNLPQWYCKKLDDLAKYLTERINNFLKELYETKRKETSNSKKFSISSEVSHQFHGSVVREENPEYTSELGVQEPRKNVESLFTRKYQWSAVSCPQVEIKMDSLDRVHISCDKTDFDIAFSDALLDILGLIDEPDFTLESFDARTLFWDLIEEETKEQIAVDDINKFHFGRTEVHSAHRSIFNPQAKLLGCNSLADLRAKTATSLSLMNNSLLKRFLLRFDIEGKIYSLQGVPLDYLAKTWPAGNEAEKYLNAKEYRNFIVESESVAVDIEEAEKSFKNERGGFSLNHNTLFAAFILKKILFGSLSNNVFISKIPGRINPHEILYIYTDLIKADPFNEMMSRILISFQTKGNNGERATFFPNPRQYKMLDKTDISNIKILIAGDRGERVPFQRGPSNITLHFRRRRRIF